MKNWVNKINSYILILLFGTVSLAEEKHNLPRFVSIKSSEANARKGPGSQYPIVHIYNCKWLPVEIISEYDQWRHVRDIDGDEVWIHSSILSNKRTVMVTGKEPQILYKDNNLKSGIKAKLMPHLVCFLNKCVKSWCKIKCSDYTGWASRSVLWGIYDYEE